MSTEHPHSAEDAACFHLGGTLRSELVSHLPFSVSSVTLGLILAGLICFLAPLSVVEPHEHEDEGEEAAAHDAEFHGRFIELFHLFHPAHMLFSAAATTAMFRRFDRRPIRALVVGFTGATLVCGLSDIFFPHFSLILLGSAPDHWHVCILQHPDLVFPFAVVGVGIGWLAATSIEKATYFGHALHVAISTMASIFYLVGPMGQLAWIDQIGAVFFFTLLAVMVPCCFSDILYPLFLTRGGRQQYARSEHAHKH